MKRQYKIHFLFRIISSIIIPFLYAVIQVFIKGKSPLTFVWISLFAAPVYSFFSMYIYFLDDELQLRISFPKNIILKRISFKNLISIDAHKNFFFLSIYIRAQADERIEPSFFSHIFDTSNDLLILSPIFKGRRDLIGRLLEKNTSLKVDRLTMGYIADK